MYRQYQNIVQILYFYNVLFFCLKIGKCSLHFVDDTAAFNFPCFLSSLR